MLRHKGKETETPLTKSRQSGGGVFSWEGGGGKANSAREEIRRCSRSDRWGAAVCDVTP